MVREQLLRRKSSQNKQNFSIKLPGTSASYFSTRYKTLRTFLPFKQTLTKVYVSHLIKKKKPKSEISVPFCGLQWRMDPSNHNSFGVV